MFVLVTVNLRSDLCQNLDCPSYGQIFTLTLSGEIPDDVPFRAMDFSEGEINGLSARFHRNVKCGCNNNENLTLDVLGCCDMTKSSQCSISSEPLFEDSNLEDISCDPSVNNDDDDNDDNDDNDNNNFPRYQNMHRIFSRLDGHWSIDYDDHWDCYCKTQNVCGCGCDPRHDGW